MADRQMGQAMLTTLFRLQTKAHLEHVVVVEEGADYFGCIFGSLF